MFLVGPTGSGKTTIFKLLIRETLPTQGDVLINDWSLVKLSKDKIPHLRKRIGVVFQDLRLLLIGRFLRMSCFRLMSRE